MIIWFYQLSWQCKLATVKRFESFFKSLYSCQFTLLTQLIKTNNSYPGHFQELLKQHRELGRNDFPYNTYCVVYFVGYCVFLFLMLFVTLCLCGQLFVDIWLSVWLNAAAEQVRHSQRYDVSYFVGKNCGFCPQKMLCW